MSARIKVTLAILVAIGCSSVGDVAISQSMQKVHAVPGGLLDQLRAVLNSFMLLGILCHMAFLGLYLYALSKEDLSFVLPLTTRRY